jgi:hypothetical protein
MESSMPVKIIIKGTIKRPIVIFSAGVTFYILSKKLAITLFLLSVPLYLLENLAAVILLLPFASVF